MRRPDAKIPDEALLPVRFGAQFEYLLLPEQIHRQSAGDKKRKLSGLASIGVLGIVLKDQRVARLVEFDKLAAQGHIRRNVAIFEVVHMAFRERLFLDELDDAKRLAPDGQDVHRSVRVALDNFNNFRGAAHACNSLRKRQQYAKLALFFQAAFHHLKITRLEDVQGKVCAGEKYDVQWEERYTIRPHSANPNHTRRRATVQCRGNGAEFPGQPPIDCLPRSFTS